MKRVICLCIVSVFAFSGGVFAGGDPYQTDPKVLSQIESLSRQIAQMQEMINNQQKVIDNQSHEIGRLSTGKIRALPEGEVPAWAPEVPKWTEGLHWGGDFRLRYDAIERPSSVRRSRNRFRFRLRYGFEKKFSDDMRVGFRLASGSLADPTSTNQSFDALFTPKSLNINRAYAIYNPNWLIDQYDRLEEVEIGGGKVSNPYKVTSLMIWDHDVEPEGVYQKARIRLSDALDLYSVLGQFVLEEDSGSAHDAELYAFKGGFKADLGKMGILKKHDLKLDTSFTYYDYSDYAIDGNFGALARGNTNLGVPVTELDARDFDVVNVYNELSLRVFDKPVKLFSDFAMNLSDQATAPADQNKAWGLGVKLGRLKQKGDWQVFYAYYNIEANSVVGAFNDSDFGAGHSDNRGSVVKLGYQLTDYLQLKAGMYFVDHISRQATDDNVSRFLIDLVWRF